MNERKPVSIASRGAPSGIRMDRSRLAVNGQVSGPWPMCSDPRCGTVLTDVGIGSSVEC